eukprot:3207837-Amphidinium_carterae.1
MQIFNKEAAKREDRKAGKTRSTNRAEKCLGRGAQGGANRALMTNVARVVQVFLELCSCARY